MTVANSCASQQHHASENVIKERQPFYVPRGDPCPTIYKQSLPRQESSGANFNSAKGLKGADTSGISVWTRRSFYRWTPSWMCRKKALMFVLLILDKHLRSPHTIPSSTVAMNNLVSSYAKPSYDVSNFWMYSRSELNVGYIVRLSQGVWARKGNTGNQTWMASGCAYQLPSDRPQNSVRNVWA